jgi:hypothetical protein
LEHHYECPVLTRDTAPTELLIWILIAATKVARFS